MYKWNNPLINLCEIKGFKPINFNYNVMYIQFRDNLMLSHITSNDTPIDPKPKTSNIKFPKAKWHIVSSIIYQFHPNEETKTQRKI